MEEIWSDLHHNIESDTSGGIRKVINADAVKTSIDNILKTRYGSRVMLPNFGCGLHDMLFAPMTQDLARDIVKDTKEAINRWDDRVTVNAVNVYQNVDESHVKVEVIFSVLGYDEVITTSSVF